MSSAGKDETWERQLAPEEFAAQEAGARASLEGPEGEEMSAYADWFLRRYPTPLERLAYSRRKFRESLAHRGLAIR